MLPYIRVTKQAESVMGIGGTGINILDRVGGGDAFASANSPLADYPGYLLDYENPYGAGRISIL